KTTKLPDPEPFTNEKGKDSPTFDVWYRQMVNKVEVNRDHFANDRALLAYIESRIRGKAAEDLAPYLREGHPNKITDPEKLMDHMWHEYTDHNTREKAVTDFDKLKLDRASGYQKFKNEFVRLAGEIGRSRSEWKTEFKRRLYGSLQRALAAAVTQGALSF
ncbi:hypothetical protein QBC35DRAFT_370465, partial [Podospora australis]